MNQKTSPPLESGSKFAAPPSMVTGIQLTGFAAKTSSATLPDAGSMARNSRYFDHLHFLLQRMLKYFYYWFCFILIILHAIFISETTSTQYHLKWIKFLP